MSKLTLRSLSLYVIFFGVGALSLLPRVVSLDRHWSPDETLWLNRSRYFIFSLQHADFPGTLQSHHPGVPTMWLAGVSLWTKYGENLPVVADEDSGFLLPGNLARCRLMVAVTIGVTILIAFLLVRQLLGTKIAILAAVFLALDPIYLAQSRRLHTDALSTSFLLLSILTLLIFSQDFKRLRYLILSGICFGIACLSKSYALIGICYFPLLMLSFFHSNFSVWIGRSIWVGLIWLGMACFTFVSGWPAILSYGVQVGRIWVPIACITALSLLGMTIWVIHKLKPFVVLEVNSEAEMWKAIRSVLIIYGVSFSITAIVVHNAVSPFLEGIGWALTTEHEIPHFFLGKIVNDPGWLFYPLMLSIQSTPLTLSLSLIGFVLLWRQRHHPKYAGIYQIYVGLTTFVILFTFCMSIGAKKLSRYLLPVFPILDILAAVGGHILMKKISQVSVLKRLPVLNILVGRNLNVLAVGLLVLIQVVPVLSLHPNYGTYYNPFWRVTDITKVCTVGGAYGLDLAADYLNQKPNAPDLTVRASPNSAVFFGHYFQGKSYRSDSDPGTLSPDYEVAYIRDVRLNRVHLSDVEGTLEHVIRLNGVDYVWIYKLTKN